MKATDRRTLALLKEENELLKQLIDVKQKLIALYARMETESKR